MCMHEMMWFYLSCMSSNGIRCNSCQNNIFQMLQFNFLYISGRIFLLFISMLFRYIHPTIYTIEIFFLSYFGIEERKFYLKKYIQVYIFEQTKRGTRYILSGVPKKGNEMYLKNIITGLGFNDIRIDMRAHTMHENQMIPVKPNYWLCVQLCTFFIRGS